MISAPPQPLALPADDEPRLVDHFPARPDEVRAGLARIMAHPLLLALNEEERGTVELVLAEVLNNVAEHAYARFPGNVEVDLTFACDHIRVCISDWGLPMPGFEAPSGALPEASAEDIPEGGFGWYMIRSLSSDLHYHREDGENALTFALYVDNWEC
jgi:serine/threonine-protein kinase RsbW